MSTATITRPARPTSPARVDRLRRQALDLIASYRDVMAWGNDKLAAAFADQECDAVTEVVNAAEDRALSALNGYWRAIGRPGDYPFVVDDSGTVHALVALAVPDYSQGYHWPFVTITTGKTIAC